MQPERVGSSFPENVIERSLLECSPQGVILVDEEGQMLYCNPAGAAILQKQLDELQGATFWSVFPEAAEMEVERRCKEAMSGRQPKDIRYWTRSGRRLDIQARPHAAGMALYVRDVTLASYVDSAPGSDGQSIDVAELQERLSAIVESSDDAVISKDLNGIIRSWNRGAQRLFGYTAEEVVGQPISILVDPKRKEEIPDILKRVSRGERVDHYRTQRVAKDGRVLSISLTVSPIRDASGAIVGASKVARDITTEKSFAELREHLASIVDSSDDAILSKDLNGIIRSWNPGAERLFGYKADEIIGKPISVLAAPDRVDEIPNILERVSRGERIEHYQTKRRAKDGRILSISLTVSPVRDASGTVIGASKVARDVTQQVQNEEALRAANAALVNSNADLEQFAYSASHDLQEPLRMISAYAGMLQRKYGGQLAGAGDEYIGYIVEGATRMEQLLRDLRAFTQASTQSPQPASPVDANEVLQRTLVIFTKAIEESGARVTHEHLPMLGLHEFQVEQLFQNLIGNAIRYRSEAFPVIHIGAQRTDRGWVISVRDNGIGIDPQYKEQIFGIFKRLHAAKEYPGTGMGLAICQRIVERSGGRIWVDSEPGKGSTFFFTVPHAKPHG